MNGSTRSKMFGNKVLRRIFASKGDEIIGGWRKLYSEELHNFYPSLNKARTTRQDETVQAWGRRRMHTGFLVGKPEGKRPVES
jgi:hypothetical protein